jgi:aspartate aminotransferase
MYDQIYWQLTYGETEHVDPVTLHPEMKAYTIFIDGISKVFAATGVRVGWSFGPTEVIDKMKALLSHIGAWSPKAEQVATAAFLNDHDAIEGYLAPFKATIHDILDGFYQGFQNLKLKGYSVDAIAPQAAIYLTVKLSLVGKILPDGNAISEVRMATDYILKSAKIALVPFHAFGDGDDSEWYRLSIGTATLETVEASLQALEVALSELK